MVVSMENKPQRPALEVVIEARELRKGDRYVERGETGRVIGKFTVISDLERCKGDPSNVHVLVTRDGEKGERVACWFSGSPVSLIA